MTGFYLKILFRSDTETHKSAVFFSSPVFVQISKAEKEKRLEELRDMRWVKLNGENAT